MDLARVVGALPSAFLVVIALSAARCADSPTSATSPNCSYRVTVQTQSFGPAGGSGSATVNTSPGCAWTAATTSDWISVARGTSGSGDGQVEFTVATYDGSADRSGTLVVAKQNLSIAQTACALQISPAEQSFSDAASVHDVNVQAQPGCRWALEGAPSWITLTPSTGTGETTVKVQVSENDIDAPRQATLHAGGATLSVKQSGEPERCLFTLDVQPAQFNETGGHGVVAVNTREGCSWQLAADSDWIRLSSSSGTGSTRVAFDVSPSPQAGDRRAMLRVDGATAPVLQLANQCSYSVTPVQQYAHSYGESGTVAIRAGAGCEWTASAAAPWIHIDRSTGTGSGEIRYTIDPYGLANRARKAPIQVRWKTPTLGENAWLWQLGNCQVGFGIPGNVITFPPDGGTIHATMFFGAFTVLCDWIAESLPAAPFSVNAPPLNVILSNEWDLYISVPPNTSGQQRTTSMTLGEATLTLTQPPK